MSGLVMLSINSTPIINLSPIAGMTGLTMLDLNNTPVMDLRPIRNLRQFVERPSPFGLQFDNTTAAKVDARIDAISKIGDSSERARELFEYLNNWEPPVDGNSAPKQDTLLPVELIGGKLEIVASLPTEAERDERLKQALHDRLRPKAAELAQLAGNRFPRLAGRARALAVQVDRPFEALDMLLVHLEVEDLSERADRGGEDDETFSPEVAAALADVVRIGPGLTLDNPDVELLEERKRRYASQMPPPELQAVHDRLSNAAASDQTTIGDNLRRLEQQNIEAAGQTATGAVQTTLHRNMLIKIGRIAGTVVLGAGGNALWAFVAANDATLLPLATSYGTAFFDWFVAALSQVQELAGIVANVEVKPLPTKTNRNNKPGLK
jgi:hypothetical protein